VFSTRCLLFSYVLKLLFAYSHIVKQVATVMEATVRIAAGVMLLLRAIFAKTGRVHCPMGVRYVHLNYLFPLGIRTPAFNEFTLQAGSFAVQPFSRYQQIHDKPRHLCSNRPHRPHLILCIAMPLNNNVSTVVKTGESAA